jgi:SAM-dependent methyltransferase/uncharacterized protein YbaR (Trm112 family)
MTSLPFVLACPRCHQELDRTSPSECVCMNDGLSFHQVDGIWRFLLPEREAHFERFINEYEVVRKDEGRGSTSPAFYRSLPFKDLSGKHLDTWPFRVKSYEALLAKVIVPLENKINRPAQIIDLGAGNGYISNHLAARGHGVAAVDLLTNSWDGLGAHRYYETDFLLLQAEYDRLPLKDDQGDLVIFNASVHYSEDYLVTIREAKRVLRANGKIVILDSPIYRDASSGAKMVKEREDQYETRYGFRSNTISSENYLTFDRLKEIGNQLGVSWDVIEPPFGPIWKLRRFVNGLRSKREPAKLPLIVGEVST